MQHSEKEVHQVYSFYRKRLTLDYTFAKNESLQSLETKLLQNRSSNFPPTHALAQLPTISNMKGWVGLEQIMAKFPRKIICMKLSSLEAADGKYSLWIGPSFLFFFFLL